MKLEMEEHEVREMQERTEVYEESITRLVRKIAVAHKLHVKSLRFHERGVQVKCRFIVFVKGGASRDMGAMNCLRKELTSILGNDVEITVGER